MYDGRAAKDQHARRRQRQLASGLTLALPLLLTGCTGVRLRLGQRVELARIPVLSMEASLPRGSAIAPGEKTPLVVSFTGQSGATLVTEGAGKGKVLWRDLAIAATVVKVDKKGNVSLPRDPRVSDGKIGHLAITIPSQPGLHTELDVPLHYDYAFTSPFYGAAGSSGLNGTDGLSGSPGSMGSIDPNNPSPGGNGGDGTNGSDGGNGYDGGDGPPVHVLVTVRPGNPQLLQIGVSAPGHKERFYLVDPQGGSLTLTSAGGNGGSGGKGGKGGQGGTGGAGIPSGMNGNTGRDGQDGRDGQSGRGGSITVTYDPQAKPFLAAIHTSNPGGPPPAFTEAPVAPLW